MLQFNSYRFGVAASIALNVVSKGLLFVVNLLVVYYFGSNSATDVYFYAYNVVFLISIFFTQLNGSVIIPESMRIRAEDGEDNSRRFLTFFLYAYVAFVGLISIPFFLSPVESFLAISNFDRSSLEENRITLQLAIPLMLTMTINGLLTDILMSFRFFVMPMIVGIINGTMCILTVVLLHDHMNLQSILIGLLLAHGISLLFLIFTMVSRLQWSFLFSKFEVGRRIWLNIGYAQAGNITSVLTSYVPLLLLSGFSPGIITALTLAQQLSQFPHSFISNQFSSIAAIKFNDLYARKDFAALGENFTTTSNLLVFLLTPISALIFLFSEQIVAFLFLHGKFNAGSLEWAALFLKFLGLQLPLLAVNTFVSRLFMASHKIGQSFWYQVLFNVFLIGMIYASVNFFGPTAYPISLVVAYVLNLLVCRILISIHFKFMTLDGVLVHMAKVVLVNSAIYLLLYLALQQLDSSNLGVLVVATIIYGLVVVGANQLFTINKTVSQMLTLGIARIRRSDIR